MFSSQCMIDINYEIHRITFKRIVQLNIQRVSQDIICFIFIFAAIKNTFCFHCMETNSSDILQNIFCVTIIALDKSIIILFKVDVSKTLNVTLCFGSGYRYYYLPVWMLCYLLVFMLRYKLWYKYACSCVVRMNKQPLWEWAMLCNAPQRLIRRYMGEERECVVTSSGDYFLFLSMVLYLIHQVFMAHIMSYTLNMELEFKDYFCIIPNWAKICHLVQMLIFLWPKRDSILSLAM